MRRMTQYFNAVMQRSDRLDIEMSWIERVIANPEKIQIQKDGRIRKWGRVPEKGNRYLHVILLPDGETLHNAFLDRGFKP